MSEKKEIRRDSYVRAETILETGKYAVSGAGSDGDMPEDR